MESEVDAKINYTEPILIINPCQLTNLDDEDEDSGQV